MKTIVDIRKAFLNQIIVLKDPIKINCFLFQKQENDFKNFLLIRTKNTLLTSCSVHQSLQRIPKYSKANNSLFFKLDQYKDQYRRLIFDIFKSDATDLLVVIYSDNHQQMQNVLKDFYEIWKHKTYTKIIFIIQDGNIINFKKYLEDNSLWKDRYMEIENKAFTLNHLTDESQRTILESLVTFQGKKIKLNKLIVEEDEILKELIDSEMLVKLIKNEVTIDHELINLSDTKNYYIDRTFKLPYIKETIFKNEKSDDLLAISGIDKTSLNRLVQEANKICLYEEYELNGNVSFIILDNEQADQQFEQLCRLDHRHNIHWLKFEQDNLIWKRTHGSISKLHEYIKNKKNDQYPENELLNQTSQQKVIVISDTSGMGKSTVLTNLALQIKEHDPALWLIRINLNEHTDQLEEQKKKVLQHKLSMKTIEVATQFLANDVLKLTIPFEQALFQYYHQHGKLIIMFDGFDEICPHYREIVIDLMLGLRNSKIKQLWVTSRPTEQLILENKLQNIAYKLESFSEQNQIDFLTKFWKQTLNTVTVGQEKLKVYANALIKLLSESTSDKDKEFTGIPLQIRMLAETFDFETFYNSSTGELQLPNKLDLIDLYEKILKKKYDIYQIEKNKLDLSKPRVKIQSDESYAEFIGKHQNLALWTLIKEHKLLLLSEKAYQEFSKNYPPVVDPYYIEILKKSLKDKSEQEIKSFINDIKTSTVNTGIIDQIIDDKPHFIHRTFAEYLVGKFLVASLDNETIFEFVLQEILMRPAYQVIRAFFNNQLPESLPEDTLARYGKLIERLWQSNQKNFYNKEGMTLLHLAAEEGTVKIIRFFLNSLKGHEKILKSLLDTTTTTYYFKTALHLAAAGGYLDVVQCLVEHGADVNVKSNHGESALHYAVQTNKWDVVKWLVEHGKANVEATDNDGNTVLHWAAQENKWDVVQWLVEHGKANVEATDNHGLTVLYCAAEKNKWDDVRWLVEHGKANVEATDNYGRTMLHWAVQKNKWDVVQWFVEHGKANVEATDNYGQTVLHCAAQNNKWDVVQWLVEHGKVNVEATNQYGQAVLHCAAQMNKWDVVQWLVEHGKANVEATDNYGKTVLHCAAQNNKWDVVQWLVEHGKVNVEATNQYGQTVLHYAAQMNKWDVVQWLVEHGKVNIEATDKYGRTVLLWAASGNLDVVQWLVEHGKANVEATDNDGRTVLHWAARGNLLVVQYLAEHRKANVEATDNHGQTVLHWAASHNLDVVQWLVIHEKANVEATDNHGQTVLHWAARNNLLVVQYLVEHGKVNVEATDNDGRTVLHWAAQENKWDVVQWLVEHRKANIETTDNYGRTVLLWAAQKNKWDVVRWLVEYGKANVEATDNYGQTVLHCAAQKNKWDVIQLLVEHGKANVESIDNDGRTVLHWAAQMNKWDVVQWLVKHGKANVEATNQYGQTVLLWAAEKNKWDVVRWLVEHGKANVEATDNYGQTVLYCAAQKNKWDVVQWLVEHGKVNVEATNKHGRTVLHWAAQKNKWDIVQWLVEHGKANVETTDNGGMTVLHYAAQENQLDVVQWLVEHGADVDVIDFDGKTNAIISKGLNCQGVP